jgi:hypothetical protein
MQNYIYRSRQAAQAANTGDLELYVCGTCGLCFNARFDSSLVSYDENYDVYIPSAIFLDYYKEIASFLYKNFPLEDATVVDIACGKGTFLEVLCGLYPNVRGLGIDPSFEFNNSFAPNLKFIKDIFRAEYITEQPALILCRHAFDQIEQPLSFLQSIQGALRDFKEVPFFIEVADLEWIIENRAFWDLCYERCSYWTADSLKNTLRRAGFQTEEVLKASNNQYLWAFGIITQESAAIAETNSISERLADYALTEKNLIFEMKTKLQDLKAEGNLLAVWGMATKGVVFCNLIDAERQLFDYCIDISEKKINCFAAHTGHEINAPDILRQIGLAKLVIIVMNPNYLTEIIESCKQLNLNPKYMDANGSGLIVE